MACIASGRVDSVSAEPRNEVELPGTCSTETHPPDNQVLDAPVDTTENKPVCPDAVEPTTLLRCCGCKRSLNTDSRVNGICDERARRNRESEK